MTRTRFRNCLPALAGILLLAGCATSGGWPGAGGGDPYRPAPYPDERYPDRGYPSQYGARLYGTVERLDAGYGRILVLEDDPRSGRAVPREVRYDRDTRLFHRGRELAVEGLERGDVVSIEVVESGRDAWARSIEVVRDVREAPGGYDRGYGGGYDGRGGGYGRDDGFDPGAGDADLRGTVSYVDVRARLIRIDSGGVGGTAHVVYDDRTTVEYRGRRHRPEDLERGDRVAIEARPLARGQWLAERIFVERAVGD